MKQVWILLAAVLMAHAARAQNSLPSGTLLPVSLETGLNAAKLHAGEQIRGRIMQNVPGTPVRRRDVVLGHVVKVNAPRSGPARLEISFDSVKTRQGIVPFHANLRALASFMDVAAAEVPEEGASRGITPEVATTEQIGGEQVYRGGGPVASGDNIVAKALAYGVLGLPRPNLARGCGGMVADNNHPQAFWLFSTDACGLYGFSDLHIQQAGRTTDAIVLTSTRSKLNVAGGSGLLLRVDQDGNGNS